jgi:hypothetical protein
LPSSPYPLRSLYRAWIMGSPRRSRKSSSTSIRSLGVGRGLINSRPTWAPAGFSVQFISAARAPDARGCGPGGRNERRGAPHIVGMPSPEWRRIDSSGELSRGHGAAGDNEQPPHLATNVGENGFYPPPSSAVGEPAWRFPHLALMKCPGPGRIATTARGFSLAARRA